MTSQESGPYLVTVERACICTAELAEGASPLREASSSGRLHTVSTTRRNAVTPTTDRVFASAA